MVSGDMKSNLAARMGLTAGEINAVIYRVAARLIAEGEAGDKASLEAASMVSRLCAELESMFDSAEGISDWLRYHVPFLGHRAPLLVLMHDGRVDSVEGALEAINSGFAS